MPETVRYLLRTSEMWVPDMTDSWNMRKLCTWFINNQDVIEDLDNVSDEVPVVRDSQVSHEEFDNLNSRKSCDAN